MTEAKIIPDSISPEGVRLTTFQITCHRFVLAEFNTHRVLSRNSASSRAIPVEKRLQQVYEDPVFPARWPAERKGMQGGADLSPYAQQQAQHEWRKAAADAAKYAVRLRGLGHEAEERLHKSVTNRLLEPFMDHTIVCTATAWENFFDQRAHEAAQPEIRVVAEMMREAYEASEPKRLVEGEWHLPYIEAEDWEAVRREVTKDVRNLGKSMYPQLTKISAARCARVSYLTQEGTRDIAKDLALYDRLTNRQADAAHAHDPIHWSPLEHVATPWAATRQPEGGLRFEVPSPTPGVQHYQTVPTGHLPRVGNLLGWRSLRTTVEAENEEITYR